MKSSRKINGLWIIEAYGGQPEKVLDMFTEGEDLFGFYGYISCQDFMAWHQISQP
jgi:hypothetical protein